jgi:hypothetical protein
MEPAWLTLGLSGAVALLNLCHKLKLLVGGVGTRGGVADPELVALAICQSYQRKKLERGDLVTEGLLQN